MTATVNSKYGDGDSSNGRGAGIGAQLATDASGNTSGIVGADGRVNQLGGVVSPVIVIGGDHPYHQWYGATGSDGVAQMNIDAGVRPYIAVNTATQADQAASGVMLDPVGGVRRLSYDDLRLLEKKGVEIVSHGVRHPTSWERINTGIRIKYLGAAGSATVNIDNTSIVLVGAGGAENVTLLYATYPTLAQMGTAISAATNWTATLAPELTGAEPTKAMLKLSAPRNVKASTANQYFAAGGGITIDYLPGMGSNYQTTQCFVRRVSAPSALKIIIGGVVRVSVDLTFATTLSAVVAAINSAAIFGLIAKLTNNNIEQVNRENYVIGDELSSGLPSGASTSYTLVAGHQRAIMTNGIGHQYCVSRQLIKSKFDLEAQGLNVTQFAQSGAEFLPLTAGSNTEYSGVRVDPIWLNPIYPNAIPLQTLSKGDWYPHFCVIYATWSTPESLIAVTKALVDSGPWYVNILVHALLSDGTSGYNILNTDPTPYYDQTESNWKAFLDDLKPRLKSREIINATPSEARRLMSMAVAPSNLSFNPRFQNSGAVMTGRWNAGTGSGNLGSIIPGWHLASDPAAFTAVSVIDDGRGDGAGRIKFTGTSSGESLMLEQVYPLEAGVYEFGIQAECGQSWVTSGYLMLVARPQWGAFDKSRASYGGTQSNYSGFGGIHSMTVRFVVEPSKHELSTVFSLNSGPFDLSVNNSLTLQFSGKTATANIIVSGATPSSTSVGEIASAINTALAASVTYGYAYRSCASVEQGKLVVRDVEYYEPFSAPGLVIAGTARDAIFGGEVLALSGINQNSGPLVPMQVRVVGNVGGDVIFSQPYLRKVSSL